MIFDREGGSRQGRVAAWLLVAVATVGVASGFDALVVEPGFRLGVTRLALPAAHGGRLARCLVDARIVHITDLHIRGFGLREQRLASELERLAPDLILMTGDYGEGADGMAALIKVLGSVKPGLGIYAVLGNNDHYRGERPQIVEALQAAGVRLLVNSSAVVEGKGGPFAIAGVDDPHYGRDDITAAMKDVPDGLPVVLLAHSPDLLRRKSRGLMVNAGDERGPWKRGWFWQDGTHVRDDTGEVTFPSTGRRRVRVIRREDGVGIEEIRLVPTPALSPDAVAGGRSAARGGLPRLLGRRNMAEPKHVNGEIVIKAAQVADAQIRGDGWQRRATSEGTSLFSAPDRGITQTWVDVNPDSYFEAEFDAVEGIRYHVWVRLRSANDSGTSDSLYLQFTDSLNAQGKPDYRIGVEMAAVDTDRVDLMLAGHEHGGQVRLPFIGALEPNVRSSPYQMGLYRVNSMPLLVSRGIGWSSLPVRFWCPPEVVVMDTGI
ncbi:MAG TPA: metallophosphoesterase [Patescibacteria group bacterium]|nr:metallophosphoesterase [Patescibacteria group bacterium]